MRFMCLIFAILIFSCKHRDDSTGDINNKQDISTVAGNYKFTYPSSGEEGYSIRFNNGKLTGYLFELRNRSKELFVLDNLIYDEQKGRIIYKYTREVLNRDEVKEILIVKDTVFIDTLYFDGNSLVKKINDEHEIKYERFIMSNDIISSFPPLKDF